MSTRTTCDQLSSGWSHVCEAPSPEALQKTAKEKRGEVKTKEKCWNFHMFIFSLQPQNFNRIKNGGEAGRTQYDTLRKVFHGFLFKFWIADRYKETQKKRSSYFPPITGHIRIRKTHKKAWSCTTIPKASLAAWHSQSLSGSISTSTCDELQQWQGLVEGKGSSPESNCSPSPLAGLGSFSGERCWVSLMLAVKDALVSMAQRKRLCLPNSSCRKEDKLKEKLKKSNEWLILHQPIHSAFPNSILVIPSWYSWNKRS